MDPNYKFPASPGTGSPLHQMSPERANQQRFDTKPAQALHGCSASHDASRHLRESSVSEKAARFESLAFQGKQLERRTNDAALKRAMLGREEAESEMRRYREETRQLKKQVEEGRDRERKVGERLENVMVRARQCAHVFKGVLADCSHRKTMAGQKKHTRIHRHYGRKKSEEHGKSRSSRNRSSSNYKKSFSRRAVL
jgi:hypothetical protein